MTCASAVELILMEVWGSLSTPRTADPREGKEVLGQLHGIFQLSDGPQNREREREKGVCLAGKEASPVECSEVLDGGASKSMTPVTLKRATSPR